MDGEKGGEGENDGSEGESRGYTERGKEGMSGRMIDGKRCFESKINCIISESSGPVLIGHHVYL